MFHPAKPDTLVRLAKRRRLEKIAGDALAEYERAAAAARAAAERAAAEHAKGVRLGWWNENGDPVEPEDEDEDEIAARAVRIEREG